MKSALLPDPGRAVKKTVASGRLLGALSELSTFFINGQRHDGADDYASLVEAIEGVLV